MKPILSKRYKMTEEHAVEIYHAFSEFRDSCAIFYGFVSDGLKSPNLIGRKTKEGAAAEFLRHVKSSKWICVTLYPYLNDDTIYPAVVAIAKRWAKDIEDMTNE